MNTAGGQLMSRISEPDDVDFFVGGIEPDARASAETARFIEEYKKRPDYSVEAEDAERILAALGINVRDYGMKDAQSLLEHWRRCVAKLHKADLGEAPEATVEQEPHGEDVPATADLPKEAQHGDDFSPLS
jgi:hypothetical protein